MGQDLARAGLAGGRRLSREVRPAEGPRQLGFNLVGFGCTTCIGNSGPLPEEISEAINENDLVAAAVLSGNRNFEGRVNRRRARQLSRLAAAGRRLRDRRLDVGRPRQAAARHRQEGQEGLPQGHLADQPRDRRGHPQDASPADVRARSTPTCSRATRTGARSPSRAA